VRRGSRVRGVGRVHRLYGVIRARIVSTVSRVGTPLPRGITAQGSRVKMTHPRTAIVGEVAMHRQPVRVMAGVSVI
jgi:hypothetical protein